MRCDSGSSPDRAGSPRGLLHLRVLIYRHHAGLPRLLVTRHASVWCWMWMHMMHYLTAHTTTRARVHALVLRCRVAGTEVALDKGDDRARHLGGVNASSCTNPVMNMIGPQSVYGVSVWWIQTFCVFACAMSSLCLSVLSSCCVCAVCKF